MTRILYEGLLNPPYAFKSVEMRLYFCAQGYQNCFKFQLLDKCVVVPFQLGVAFERIILSSPKPRKFKNDENLQ